MVVVVVVVVVFVICGGGGGGGCCGCCCCCCCGGGGGGGGGDGADLKVNVCVSVSCVWGVESACESSRRAWWCVSRVLGACVARIPAKYASK